MSPSSKRNKGRSVKTPPRRNAKLLRVLPWAFLALIAVTGALFAATHFVQKPGYLQLDESCVCGAIYTLKVDYPAHPTVEKWDIITATLVNRGGTMIMQVPFTSNAQVTPLQPANEWCTILPGTSCILQWAVKAADPGAIIFHVLPTFRPTDPKSKYRFRWDINIGPVTAGASYWSTVSNAITLARNVFLALSAILGFVLALFTVRDRLTSKA
jgi:hypothetical protein